MNASVTSASLQAGSCSQSNTAPNSRESDAMVQFVDFSPPSEFVRHSWEQDDFCGNATRNKIDPFSNYTDQTENSGSTLQRQMTDVLVKRGKKVAQKPQADLQRMLSQMAQDSTRTNDPVTNAMNIVRLMQMEQMLDSMQSEKITLQPKKEKLRPRETVFSPKQKVDFSTAKSLQKVKRKRSYKYANRFRIGAMAVALIVVAGISKHIKSSPGPMHASHGSGQHSETLQEKAAKTEQQGKSEATLGAIIENTLESAFVIDNDQANLER